MNSKCNNRTSQAAMIIALIAVIAALRLGRDVLMPLALAILLSFLLAPLVIRLQRRLGRIASVILVTATAFTVLAGLSWLVLGQVAQLAGELPAYKENIRSKISSLRETLDNTFGPASQTVEEISVELSTSPTAAPDIAPVVQVSDPLAQPTERFSRAAVLTSWAGALMGWLKDAAVVIVFVIVILMTYDDLRDRILRLIGTGHLNVTTTALDDAAGRVSRYLLMQAIINACHGILVGVGLYFLGIPAALFWGLNSALLRYIPYLGPLVAAALPIGLAFAVFDNWTTVFMTISFFIMLEIMSNNVLEPWLYGSSTGLSPLAIVVAAVFWTWLWGGIGLVLSAPLTVCLVVLGKHVAQLDFLNIVLSDKPVLNPKDRLYQRLLAMDQEAALEVAENYLEGRSLEEVYDKVLIPALAMSEHDRHHGDLEEAREKFILANMKDIIEELGEADPQHEGTPRKDETADRVSAAQRPTSVNILCLPARDEADELVGTMFAQLLERDGHNARCLSVSSLAGEMLDVVEKEGTQIVVISALPPSALIHARYLGKRLRAKFEDLNLVVGLWNIAGDPQRIAERIRQGHLVQGVTTLAAGREVVRQLAHAIVLQSSTAKRNGT